MTDLVVVSLQPHFLFLIQVEDETSKAIICDLGVANVTDCTSITQNVKNAGTLGYQHIEQLKGETPHPSHDVYSFGVITLEVYTRVPAWKGFKGVEVNQKILNGEYPLVPDALPENAMDIVNQCFTAALLRPSFREMLPILEKLLVNEGMEIW